MLQCERDDLIKIFTIDECIRDYYIRSNIPFNESDIDSEKFVIKCMELENSEHDLITKEYADFVNRILIYRIRILNAFLGVENTNKIINNFKIKDYKILSWINLLQSYNRLIGICHKELESCETSQRNSIYCVKFEVTEQFAKTLMNLIFDINNILGKKIEDHNNHNIELLKKAAINKLSNSFEAGNFIEPFRSEVSPNMVIDELRRFFNIENCIKDYMPAFLIDYNYSQFIDKYILNGYIKDYDAITKNYATFVNYCVSNIKRVRELRFIIEPIDNTNTKLTDNAIDKLKLFWVWKNSDDDKKTWDDLLNHYFVFTLCRSTYESDRLVSDPNIFCEVICNIIATQLYNFVYKIRSRSRELKKANKFSSLFGNNLDFTHGKFADVEVGYPRSKTEEGGYCTIAGTSELLEIDYSDKPALAMRAMGMIKGKGITPEEFKNLIEKVSSPVVDSVNKVIEQEKWRREKMIDEIAREFNLQLDRIARLNEFYNKDKILYKPYQIYNNIFGGNNNMNQKAFTIKDIIFSGDRTIALWENGDKTIVRMQDDETVYDPEKAIMALFMKRVYEMYNLPARQKSMNKDLDKYLAKYNEHKDEIAAYLAKKNNKTTDDTNKAE